MKSSVLWKNPWKMLDLIRPEDSKSNKKPGKDNPVKIPVGFNTFTLMILAVLTAILLNPFFISAGSSDESQQKNSLTVQDLTKNTTSGIHHPAPDDKTQKPGIILTINVSIGNLYSRPTVESSIVDKLKKGDEVTLIRKINEWYIVMLQDGLVGWAHENLFHKSLETQIPAKEGIFKEIKKIQFVKSEEGDEMVTILLGGNYPPQTFSLQDGKPRVVCDFTDIRLAGNIPRHIKTDGHLIKQIRIGIYKGSESSESKVRVVLDLVSHQDCEYEVRPVFIKDENLYSLIIKKIQSK